VEENGVKDEAEQRSAPTGAVVYHAICTEGESELQRPSSALMWSGLAAGLSMGFTFITTALLHSHTEASKWQPLLTSLGYPVGFVIVVLGRQQLFTENTLTVVLPFLTRPRMSTFLNVARVWAVVLAANVVGALAVAYVLASTDAVSDETFQSMRTLAKHAYQSTFSVTLLRGIFAGWLIALMVWLLPFAEAGRIFVIGLITYVVGVAHFSHIIAGTVDAAFLVFVADKTWLDLLTRFFVPALLGNIIGGVLLVAAINHAQVKAGGGGEDA
jgi:formate/nitrite transporter FocA (FNT family)